MPNATKPTTVTVGRLTYSVHGSFWKSDRGALFYTGTDFADLLDRIAALEDTLETLKHIDLPPADAAEAVAISEGSLSTALAKFAEMWDYSKPDMVQQLHAQVDRRSTAAFDDLDSLMAGVRTVSLGQWEWGSLFRALDRVRLFVPTPVLQGDKGDDDD